MFDYLIVGSGLFGATCAHELQAAGKRVLVVEKNGHIAGNCFTAERDGQIFNAYGGHIFHTNDARLWQWIQQFGEWRQYSHHVKASVNGVMYSFPPNRMTYQQAGTNDREKMITLFYAGYTAKMWERPYADLPESVKARVPMRDDWSDEYFTDEFQAMPKRGYTDIIRNMLGMAEVRLDTDYLKHRHELDALAHKTIYTGRLDSFFGNDAGALEWRGLTFHHWLHSEAVYQGAATVNYPALGVPYLREEEWRYFYPPEKKMGQSLVTTTYPGGEPAYPVNDQANNRLAEEYKQRARALGYLTGGRLADYRYYDMHQAIAAARRLCDKELMNGNLHKI